jgi:cytochrome c551/c552
MRVFAFAAVLLIAGVASAQADDATLLFKKYKCTMCHAKDRRVQTAPSYDEIMKKYSGQKDAGAKLVKAIKQGSSGAWGMTAMPPNATIPDTDVEMMVTWILKH